METEPSSAFLLFLLGLLLLYYAGLVVLFWFKRERRNISPHYENELAPEEGDHDFQPITVSSNQLPSEIVPLCFHRITDLKIWQKATNEEGIARCVFVPQKLFGALMSDRCNLFSYKGFQVFI